MPFVRANFAKVSQDYADTIKTFAYRTPDTQADVNTTGYFNAVADQVAVGDVILATVATGTTPTLVTFLVNQVTAAGVVDVTDGVADATTDTD